MKHKDEILRLRSEGKTYNEIQKITGASKGTISYHINPKVKEKTIERHRGNRRKIEDYIREYKESRGCLDCGKMYPYYILDFDHVKEKKFNISRFSETTNSLCIVKEEIEKCEVVCANCHRIRTWSRYGRVAE